MAGITRDDIIVILLRHVGKVVLLGMSVTEHVRRKYSALHSEDPEEMLPFLFYFIFQRRSRDLDILRIVFSFFL